MAELGSPRRLYRGDARLEPPSIVSLWRGGGGAPPSPPPPPSSSKPHGRSALTPSEKGPRMPAPKVAGGTVASPAGSAVVPSACPTQVDGETPLGRRVGKSKMSADMAVYNRRRWREMPW